MAAASAAALLTLTTASAAPVDYPPGSVGYDVSYPQCNAALPGGGTFGIVGVTNGLPWSVNPCLASQYGWAASRPSGGGFYMNTANPGPISSHWTLSGPAVCTDPNSYSDNGCAYNYGWNAAAQAFNQASTAASPTIAAARPWWLDVETANSWNGSLAANAADLQGSLDFFHAKAAPSVGIYSTGYQWGVITGSYQAATAPDWLAGAGSQSEAASFCSPAYSFSGGPVELVQFPSGGFDGNLVCGTAPPPTQKPDFSLAASPSSQTVSPGASTSYSLNLKSLNGYTRLVNLTVSGLPRGASGKLAPSSVTPSSAGATSRLTVSTSTRTVSGSYQLTVVGTDASGVSHRITLTLVVGGRDNNN